MFVVVFFSKFRAVTEMILMCAFKMMLSGLTV